MTTTTPPHPTTTPVGLVASFRAHVAQRPQATALVWRGREVAYRQLYSLVRRAHGGVRGLSLGAEEPVAVVATKSPAVIALVMACFVEGRPCLLLAPNLPSGATRSAAQQAGCRFVLGADESWSVQPWTIEGPIRRQDRPGPPAGTCIMLTTSGSTGAPKVVALGRSAVDRFITWAADRFGIGTGTTTLSTAPLNFVVSLLDLWTTLGQGGQVVLVDPARATHPSYLADLITSHRVEVVQGVPTLYRVLLEAPAPKPLTFPTVRHAISTGDSITPGCLARLADAFPDARLYNAYGCTETVASFLHEVTALSAHESVPIGRPVEGVRAEIVDEGGMAVVGPGTGELLVATPFQSSGYLDPAMTADRFVHRADDGPATAWFRTGDLAHRDADGLVHLVGRTDFQVKVRGVRINTQEVEFVLRSCPGVMEAAVLAVPDPVDGRVLHAVVRPAATGRVDSLALRRACAERLPRWAIPAHIVVRAEPLPTTPTGKLDRRALSRFIAHPSDTDTEESRGPDLRTDRPVHRR